MTLIDTHCHLVSERLRDNVAEFVQAAAENGVSRILNIAYDPTTIALACEHAAKFAGVYAAIGIQPHDSNTYTPEEAENVRRMAKENKKVAAIGEIGLDNYHKDCPLEIQIPCFEHFIDISCDVKLPIVVHVRETHKEVASRIQAFKPKGVQGVIHCFTGTVDEAREFLDLGMYISFSGIVTFKNAEELKRVAKFVPSDRFLVETDSPYLAPIPHRGKTNQPAWVKHVAECIAEQRGVSFEDVAQRSTQNALKLFHRIFL